ncbi:hypothetical protein DRF65_12055 [Chryseobacterium pennae]|uniref:Uncharacterized protein n=1 Tax=Chryseobacterium pennae TaxID=2258962 RepID=A0A3D9C9B5_9FLAO|nr:hypothetical protein DRF65_12055 [Chryseobacterium pennae]
MIGSLKQNQSDRINPFMVYKLLFYISGILPNSDWKTEKFLNFFHYFFNNIVMKHSYQMSYY